MFTFLLYFLTGTPHRRDAPRPLVPFFVPLVLSSSKLMFPDNERC